MLRKVLIYFYLTSITYPYILGLIQILTNSPMYMIYYFIWKKISLIPLHLRRQESPHLIHLLVDKIIVDSTVEHYL